MSQNPDRQIIVSLGASTPDPLRVLHPCRCDAPDPESTRFEPLDVPLAPLRLRNRLLVVCPECDFHLLAIAADADEANEWAAEHLPAATDR